MAYQKQTYQDGVTEYTDTLFEHMDDGIFGAYPVQLIAISDTAPSTCAKDDKYYNSTSKKIFTATGTNTWGSTGETPLVDTSYWLISENGNYAWDGTDLVSIGGGKAEVVISDEEPEEGKLWVDTAEIQTIAGRDRLVNVSNEVDEDYRVNLLKGKNLFMGNPVYINNNATYSQISNGIKITATIAGASFILFRSIDVSNKVGVKYTIKANFEGAGQYIIGLCDENGGNRIIGTTISQSGGEGTYTIPTITTSKYLAIWLYGPSQTTGSIDYTNIMLNEGSTALPYEPYITPSIYVDNEEIYSKDNLDIVDITKQITLKSGYTIANGGVYKQGKHVFGMINIGGSFSSGVQVSQVMTLPVSPSTNYISGGFITNSDQWGVPSGIAYVYISTSGNMNIVTSSNATYVRVHFDIVVS